MAAQLLKEQAEHAQLDFERVGEVLVLCQRDKPPSDAEWNRWIACSVRNEHRCVLVSTRGGAPTAAQRTRLAKARDTPEQVALLTDSAVLRGVLTAMSWVTGNQVKAFSPQELSAALRWLKIPAEQEREIDRLMTRLHTTLDHRARRNA